MQTNDFFIWNKLAEQIEFSNTWAQTPNLYNKHKMDAMAWVIKAGKVKYLSIWFRQYIWTPNHLTKVSKTCILSVAESLAVYIKKKTLKL